MKFAAKLIFILLCSICQAYAGLSIKEQPLVRNGFKLELRSYIDSEIKPISQYPDLLIIHGLTYSSHQFDLEQGDYNLAKALTQQGFRVWLLDITGYGQSQKPKNGFTVTSDYAVQDINAAADFIMQTSQIKKINVLGWSWGTITSSRFAAEYPNKVNKLILYAPIMHGLALPAPQNDYQTFSDEAAKGDFQVNKNGMIDSSLADPALVLAYLNQIKKFDGAGSPNGGRKDLFQAKTVELIPYKKLSIPVLFIAGDHDPYVDTQKDIPLMMKYAPKGSCQEIINGGGHALFLEKPFYLKFQHDVPQFLAKGCPSP